MPFYVVGGEYTDTSFDTPTRDEEILGPFEAYEDAFDAWRARAIATIDLAYVRYRIVRSEERTLASVTAGGAPSA